MAVNVLILDSIWSHLLLVTKFRSSIVHLFRKCKCFMVETWKFFDGIWNHINKLRVSTIMEKNIICRVSYG